MFRDLEHSPKTTNRIMKILATLIVSLSLAASLQAAVFVAKLTGSQVVPPTVTTGGGGALLTVNFATRAWSLTGAISNLVFSARAVGIHGPAPAGANADWRISLGHNVEPEGPLDGGGVFTVEELDWLANGLLYVNVITDPNQFPDGEIRGQFALVPEPGSVAVLAGIALGAFAVYRRLRRQPRGLR
jgi:hypothetical protein